MGRRLILAVTAAWAIGGMAAAPAEAASCRDEAGAARADLYVRQCLAITSATHPPCNAENSCGMIGGHIQDMCARAGASAPDWCAAYAKTAVPNPPPKMAQPQPGFDCAKATTPVDREICTGGHDDIADDDREMSELYAQLQAKTTDLEGLRAEQRDFLRDRQGCGAPEPGRAPGTGLLHCISLLTHERLRDLKQRIGGGAPDAWEAYPDPCQALFGGDGWDNLIVQPSGRVTFGWLDLRERVLQPKDEVRFEIDGTLYPARLEPDGDGQLTAVSTDPQLLEAFRQGRLMAKLRRNGKVILRVPLAGFTAAYAKAQTLCGKPAKK